MRKLLLAFLALLVLLPGVAVVRALGLDSEQVRPDPDERIALLEVDAEAAAERLAVSLTYPTISNLPPQPIDTAAFLGLHEYLESTYPAVHRELRRERVNRLSLLYTWEGRDPELPPVVLMGHLDVVPVSPGTEEDWTHGAFEGVVADGYVWGRGAVDHKVGVLAVLEAVEALVEEGHRPRRTLFLAFGHDEEVGGPLGAAAMADTVERRSAGLAMVVDEGGAVVRGMLPGLPGPGALVGVAEKGYVSLRLRAETEGGHSSVPPASTSVGILAEAIRRLEENPFPARLDGPSRAMLETIAPEANFVTRVTLGNLWLTGPLVERLLVGNPGSAAMLRTTTAATMFEAGVKDNVLPATAEAVVNFRIRPGETVESTTARVREVIGDQRVQVALAYEGSARDPTPVSDPEGEAFRLLSRTIHEALGIPDLTVAPYLVVGGTDAKHYAGRSADVFRFLPVDLGEVGLSALHGTDERVPVEEFAGAIRFFHRLILNTDDLPAARRQAS